MRVLCLLQKLELDRFMLYAHGPDLCRESDLRHAMANCFEALIGETLTRAAGLLLTYLESISGSDPIQSGLISPVRTDG